MHQLFKVSQREEKGKGRELVRTYSRLLLLLFSSTSSSSSTNINNNNDYYSRVERERILPPMDLALSLARSIDPSSLPVFLSLARSVLPRSSFFSLSLSLARFFLAPFSLFFSLSLSRSLSLPTSSSSSSYPSWLADGALACGE